VLLDTPPERRAVLFAEVSGGDPVRRAELERLVAECERAYPLLDRPAADRFAALIHTPPLQASQVVAERYRIGRELGRGGMATVYLAHDLKHGRDVALKVVRPELAAALGSGRFLREIEIAARLRHPHIVPLYDSGRISNADAVTGGVERAGDDLVYYVMPYEHGESLRERVRREGRLSIADAVAILRDICEALAYAHTHGVVHRDIKPDNVLLSGGHALVTDFGVARAATEARDSSSTTGAGVMLGTPTYMAPEQVAADPKVDHRADIYAAGVLAYELLAGSPPFGGDSPQDVLAAQLTRMPEPITTHRSDMPAALADLVMKCLEKNPADRWQRAEDIVAALQGLALPSGSSTGVVRRPRRSTRAAIVAGLAAAMAGVALAWAFRPTPRISPPPQPPPPPIAVLVFDHGSHSDLAPLAVTLTDNLIGALGNVSRLNVRSLRAVWPYRDGRASLDSVRRSLGVDWLVTGRVYRLRNDTLASVELTDGGGQLLARQQAPAGDDPAVVENLVAEVTTMLRERIGTHVRLERWRAGTRNAEAFASVNHAYRDFRDADALMERDLPGARMRLRRADSTLQNAIVADPDWTEPHILRAWIARRLAAMLGAGAIPRDSFVAALGRGIDHANAALRVQPGEPRALEVRGILLHDQSLLAAGRDSARLLQSAAEIALKQATDVDSTLARGLNALSSIHYRRGELARARLMAARAHAADAFSEDGEQVLGRLFNIAIDDGNDAEARKWCAEYARRFPREWMVGYCRLMLMAWDPAEAPDPEEAWRVARVASDSAAPVIRRAVDAQLRTLFAGVLARLGRTGDAHRVLDSVHAAAAADSTFGRGQHGAELLQLEAAVRVRLGQPDTAMRLLEEYLRRFPDAADRLRQSRRFKGLPIDPPRDTSARGP